MLRKPTDLFSRDATKALVTSKTKKNEIKPTKQKQESKNFFFFLPSTAVFGYRRAATASKTMQLKCNQINRRKYRRGK